MATEKKTSAGSRKRRQARKAPEGRVLRFDMPSCGGCRTCEMACSFHHRGEFAPSVSSLVIADREKAPGCEVLIVDGHHDERAGCDGCEELDMPLCVEHCKESDDLWKILQAFLEERDRDKDDP